jgi:pimeloyl-ACP methyl ester carboxylesterase
MVMSLTFWRDIRRNLRPFATPRAQVRSAVCQTATANRGSSPRVLAVQAGALGAGPHTTGARWELFETSSHTPHVEEPDRFLRVVEGFLEEVERRG